MTLTDEQKNNIIRSVVSVEPDSCNDYYTYLKKWTIILKSGVSVEVNSYASLDNLKLFYTATLIYGNEFFMIDNDEDLAEALVYHTVMDEKEAHLEEQRKEKIRFESIIDSIGKEPTVTFDKINYKTPARVPEFEGELVNDISPTFWQRVWNSVKNYDKGIGVKL